LEHRLRNTTARELGYDEVYNYSFVSLEQVKKLGDDKDKYLELDRPISKEKPYLRRELLSNLLENIQKNIENFDQVNIFEIGKVYFGELAGLRAVSNQSDLLPRQDCYFTAVSYAKKNSGGFVGARLALEKIMADLKIEFVLQTPAEIKKVMHPGKAGEIVVGEKSVGFVFEVSPQTAKAWDLTERIGCLELNLNSLEEVLRSKNNFIYQSLPEFPESTRDLAFIVDKKNTHQEILESLQNISPILKSVELFDVYEGEHMKVGTKSMAYRFVFGNSQRTLTTQEVDEAMEVIIKKLKDKFGVEVRG